MKWDYDVETLREFGAKDGRIDGDIVEALRAIAEQLERVVNEVQEAHVTLRTEILTELKTANEQRAYLVARERDKTRA